MRYQFLCKHCIHIYCTGFFALSVFFPLSTNSQTLQTGQHFFAVVDNSTQQVVRRGETGTNGIAFNNLILAPETNYTAWILQASTLNVGSVTFTTGRAGRRFNVPEIFIGPSSAPDTDGDGLTDDGEIIMGTSPTNSDTDADGISDSAEILQGTDPLSGLAARTGIIGSVDTPGDARAICALNDIAAIADGNSGVSVFNVFNGMRPALIAQINTPGFANAISCAGDLLAVADGSSGLAIIDISDPPASSIIHQVALNGSAHGVITLGNLAYVALTNGTLVRVDITAGSVLDEVSLGNNLQDIAASDTALYALTRTEIISFPLTNGSLVESSRVEMSGRSGVGGRRFRLFVADDILYAVDNAGYRTYDITDPLLPVLIADGNDTAPGWKNIVVNGAGIGVGTVGTASNDSGFHHIGIYDVSDPSVPLNFLTQFQTPGIARDVTIYNGIGYAADGVNGLQVINYLAFDANGISPTIQLQTSANANDEIEAGQVFFLSADTDDDVQVRNVEFYINGVKQLTDGNFPFSVSLVAPFEDQTELNVRARVSDTGGNSAFSETITLTVVPDSSPPVLQSVTPRDGQVIGQGRVITAFLSEPVSIQTAESAFSLINAGSDNIFSTGDDFVIAGSVSGDELTRAVSFSAASALEPGRYRAEISDALTDLSGNNLETAQQWEFTIYDIGEDADFDGVPDALEEALGLDPNNPDSDGDLIPDGEEDFDSDGLNNAGEVLLGNDPFATDTDGDGILDGDEDSDNDGLLDIFEVTESNSDRFNPDLDDDGFPDGIEWLLGSDLNDALSVPMAVDVDNDPVVSEGKFDFGITLSNQNETEVSGVVIVVEIPQGLSFHEDNSVSPDADSVSCGGTSTATAGLTCTVGEEARWTLGTLAVGESRTILISANVDADLVDGSLITLPVVISGTGVDSVSLERTVQVNNSPAVNLALAASTDPVGAGETFSYVLDLGNPTDTDQSNVGLSLALPSNVTVSAISDGGTQSGDEITWTVASLTAGSVINRQVDVTVAGDASDGQILSSRAEVQLEGGLQVDASAEQTITIDNSITLLGAVGASPNPVAAGSTLDYELTVSNPSADSVAGVTVFLRTPQGLSFHEDNSVSPDADSVSCGGTSTATAGLTCTVGEEARWTLGTLAVGESRTILISANVDADLVDGSLITLPVVISGTGVDSVSLERTVQVNNSPAVNLALAASTDPVGAGETFSYVLDLGNPTDTDQSNVGLSLALPSNVTVSAISDGGTQSGDEITWTVASLTAGSVINRQVDVTVAGDASDGQILSSRAEVQLEGGLQVDASAEQTITIDNSITLLGAVGASPNPVAAGSTLDYELTVSNPSADSVAGVTVFLRTPQGLSFHEDNSVSPDADSVSCGGTSTATAGLTCTVGEEARWTLGTLAVGESRTILISANVDADLVDGSLITLPVVISGTGVDSVSLERTVQVNNSPAVNLALAASTDPVGAGETFSYVLDLGNPTDTDQSNVGLSLALPSNVTVSAISDGGTQSGDEITWTVASLTAGSVINRQVDVTVAGDASDGQILSSRAEVQLEGGLQVDASAEQTITIDNSITLLGAVGASPNPVAAGSTLDYELTVSNPSADSVAGVTVFLRTPQGLSFHEDNSVSPDADSVSCGGTSTATAGLTCTVGEEARWTLGTLAVGESRTILISANVDADLVDGSLITLPVVISGTGVDSVSLERTVQVNNSPAVNLALAASTDPVGAGETFSYVLDLGNPTDTDQSNVGLSLALPSNVTVSAISDGGTQSGDEITWTVASLTAGSVINRQVDVTVAGDASDGQILSSRAEVQLEGGLQVDASAEQTITIDNSITLLGAVGASPNPVAAGSTLDYELTVSNPSADSVAGVTVFLRTPQGLSFHEDNSVSPDADSVSCGGTSTATAGLTCTVGEEARWTLGTLAVGESRTILISANVDADLVDGSLITLPVVISGTGVDSVSLERTVQVNDF